MNSTVRFGLLTALMLSASCAVAHQASINGNYLAIYRTPWHMVQDLLVTQPAVEVKKQHTTRWGIIKAFGYGIGAGLTATALQKFVIEPNFIRQGPNFLQAIARSSAEPVELGAAIGGTIAAFGTIWSVVARYTRGRKFLKAEEMKQVGVVLDQWNEVRSYFPKSLQPLFDTLHELRRTESPDYLINVERALEIVKSEVALNAR